MITFHNVRWKNILSTGNVFTEINLEEYPNVLIVGENGAGKSTILDALHFVLYGKPFRKIKKDQLINSVNQREALVEIEFTVNGRRYKVVRGLKPTVFEIYEDGLLLDQHAAAKDSQEYLENHILKLNSKSFAQIVILGSSSFVPFMQLPTGVRREVIEDLLDIRIFSTMQTLLKERVSSNKEDIALNKKDVDSIGEMIKLQEDQLKREREQSQETADQYNNRISELESSIQNSMNDIEFTNMSITTLQASIEDESENDKFLSRASSVKQDLKTKLSKTKKIIDFYNTTTSCPTCTQEISESFRSESIEKKHKTVMSVEEALNDIENKISEADKRRQSIELVQNEINRHQKKVSLLQTEIQKDQREIGVIRHQIDQLNNRVQHDTQEKLNQLFNKREETNNKKEKLLNHREVLDMANIILRDSGIKSRIIKQYVPIINSLVNKYLAAMDFFVKFELNEGFEERILSRHRDDFTYDSFSEGEKMRIDLALLFTWRTIARMKNSSSTNLLILDEVFDASLDANGCDEFLKLIHNLENANVFVISHKGDVIQDKFISTLRFEKHKNFSRIAA